MTHGNYIIRHMHREEMAIAIQWAEREGWNPGKFDAESYFYADPEGFFIGELDGRIIAMISIVRYGNDFAFLGFYIVQAEYRGRGFGLAIWREASRFAGARIIGLDGVPAQEGNYRKSGFAFQYNHIRCCGVAPAGRPSESPAGVVSVAEIPFDELVAYDARRFGVARKTFLKYWVRQTGSVGLAVRTPAGNVTGYGMMRPASTGQRIGPLFADTPEMAETLFDALVHQVPPGAKYFIDMPEINANAEALADRHRLKPGSQTVRMYANGVLNLPVSEIYGTTTLELG